MHFMDTKMSALASYRSAIDELDMLFLPDLKETKGFIVIQPKSNKSGFVIGPNKSRVEILSTNQLAPLLGISYHELRKLVACRTIDCFRWGQVMYFCKEDIEIMLSILDAPTIDERVVSVVHLRRTLSARLNRI